MNLTRIKKISNLLSALLLLSAAVLLLICSDPVRKGVRDGLKSCAVVLIPSLFPFMVLSGILGESRAAESLQKILGPVMRLSLIHISSIRHYVSGGTGTENTKFSQQC